MEKKNEHSVPHTHNSHICRKKMIFHELCSNVHFSLAITDEDDIKSGSIRTIKEICCASCLKSVECMLQNTSRTRANRKNHTLGVCAFSCSYFISLFPSLSVCAVFSFFGSHAIFFASNSIRCAMCLLKPEIKWDRTHTHNQDSNNVYHVWLFYRKLVIFLTQMMWFECERKAHILDRRWVCANVFILFIFFPISDLCTQNRIFYCMIHNVCMGHRMKHTAPDGRPRFYTMARDIDRCVKVVCTHWIFYYL